MFSFVIFDKYEETLKLVTDGFGIKPMYYHTSDFVVCSEIQPITRLIKSKLSVAKDIEQQYILTGEYDKNLRTFYQDIKRFLQAIY